MQSGCAVLLTCALCGNLHHLLLLGTVKFASFCIAAYPVMDASASELTANDSSVLCQLLKQSCRHKVRPCCDRVVVSLQDLQPEAGAERSSYGEPAAECWG